MILPGTYANGFAPRDGEPLFPELWRGCVGAYGACLGCTGQFAHDQSPKKNRGAMQSGAAWTVSGGRFSYSFNGTTDYIDCEQASSPSLPVTFSAWIRPASITGTRHVVLQHRRGFTDNYISLRQVAAAIQATHADSGGNAANSAVSGLTVGVWVHVAAVFASEISRTVYLNGVAATPNTTSRTLANINYTRIGNIDWSTGQIQFFAGDIDDVVIYNRILSPNEIRLLASRRGIAYEMAPRNWTSQQIAAYRARYYSQVIGSGVI
jgi:hypothetical protein